MCKVIDSLGPIPLAAWFEMPAILGRDRTLPVLVRVASLPIRLTTPVIPKIFVALWGLALHADKNTTGKSKPVPPGEQKRHGPVGDTSTSTTIHAAVWTVGYKNSCNDCKCLDGFPLPFREITLRHPCPNSPF
jgi:hypothetical protein